MRQRTWSDDDLREAVAASDNLSQVCKRLGIAPGKRTYALLERHIARLELSKEHWGSRSIRRPTNRRDPQPHTHNTRHGSWSDDDLREAVAYSQTLAEVCARLNVTPGARAYEQLRRQIRRLGMPADHLPAVERPQQWSRQQRARRGRWNEEDLREVVAASTTLSQVLRSLGYKPNGGMHRYVSQAIRNLGIDTSHFLGQAWARGQRRPSSRRRPLEEILVQNSTYTTTGNLRRRLIAEGLKPPYCQCCGLDSWLGEPLPLALDHINGDHNDNRIENLRILCPNCHALTETWCGKRNRKLPA